MTDTCLVYLVVPPSVPGTRVSTAEVTTLALASSHASRGSDRRGGREACCHSTDDPAVGCCYCEPRFAATILIVSIGLGIGDRLARKSQ